MTGVWALRPCGWVFIVGEPDFDLAPHLDSLVRNCRRNDRAAPYWRRNRSAVLGTDQSWV